jgi:chemotaxis protein methyltransferase CheR
MTPSEFDQLRGLLRQRSGLDLSVDMQDFAEKRLASLARRTGFETFSYLMQSLRAGNDAIVSRVVETMTTTETCFFSDRVAFNHLRETVLPGLLRARALTRSLRIWSAASSTGQEPYSVAMCINERADDFREWHVEIVATDISRPALARSQDGLFSQFDVQRGLPVQLLLKYFEKVGEAWRIDSRLRAMVKHQPFNLLDDPAPLGLFDVILCRNVLTYFDDATQSAVLSGLTGALQPDGYLMIGGPDTVHHLSTGFTPHPNGRGLYRRDLRQARQRSGIAPFKVVA